MFGSRWGDIEGVEDGEVVDPPAMMYPQPCVPQANFTLRAAILCCSDLAHAIFLAAVQHTIMTGGECDIAQQKYYVCGKFRFHYKTFIHGLKRRSKTGKTFHDRTFWHENQLFTPFDHIRRVLAKKGHYLMYIGNGGRKNKVKVLTRGDILGDGRVTTHTYGQRPVRVYGDHIEWHTLNIVPH